MRLVPRWFTHSLGELEGSRATQLNIKSVIALATQLTIKSVIALAALRRDFVEFSPPFRYIIRRISPMDVRYNVAKIPLNSTVRDTMMG